MRNQTLISTKIPSITNFVPQPEFNAGINSDIRFIGANDIPVQQNIMLKNAAEEELNIKKKELQKAERVKEFEQRTKQRAKEIRKRQREEKDKAAQRKSEWNKRLPLPRNYPRKKPSPKKVKKEKVCVVGVDEDARSEMDHPELLGVKDVNGNIGNNRNNENHQKAKSIKADEEQEIPRDGNEILRCQQKAPDRPKIMEEIGWEDIQMRKAGLRARLRKKHNF